jgi:hypothetical protein
MERVAARTGTDFVVQPCPADRLDELFRLRASVWLAAGADPAAFPDGRWQDARDARRQHWIAVAGDEVVGGASLGVYATLDDMHQPEAYHGVGLVTPGPVAGPDRLVVRADWRGRYVVQRLLDAQETAARASGAVIAARQASRMLRPILLRRGWREHGPAPHDARFGGEQFTVMSLDLTAR